VKILSREVNEVRKSGMIGFGNDGKVPDQILETIEQTRGVIRWGDCEYDVDEFRLLVQKKDRSVMGEDHNGSE
jgi:hypothetical protein